jgi:hypothetical protein
MCIEAEKWDLDCSADFTPIYKWKYTLDQLIATIYWFFALLGKKHENTTLQRFLDNYGDEKWEKT